MVVKIRGGGDERTRMMLGQMRKVFNPDWLQQLGGSKFTIQFREEPEFEDELRAFAEMHGYEFNEKTDAVWTRYYFR